MLNFTLFTATTCGDKTNCLYPNKQEITNRDSFSQAMQYDHVCGAFKNNYRSNGNFLESNVIPMDCDNDHSDSAKDWVYPIDVARTFPDCTFYVNYSRSHLKPKGSKSARPRFHIYFPIPTITSGTEYAELKKKIQELFPYFDEGALGEARFFFGTQNPQVEIYEGAKNILDYALRITHYALEKDAFAEFDDATEQIQEGSRNTSMSRAAARFIKRHGNTELAYQLFLQEAEKCNPPLDETELKQIWNSACKFGKRISQSPGYIQPEIYNSTCNLKPADYSDAGQADVLVREYQEKLRYTTATKFIVYNGSFWEESEPDSLGLSLELTERQLAEVDQEINKLTSELNGSGVFPNGVAGALGKRMLQKLSPEQVQCYQLYEAALEYKKFITKHRSGKAIESALQVSIPKLKIDHQKLDADAFALNCPSGTWDLRKGVNGKREHNWEDYVTMETLVDPGTQGQRLWQEALDTFFKKDAALIEYVQQIVGLVALGKVFLECIIIAYGDGCNGKSTFWNSISRVLGGYSGSVSPEILISEGLNNPKTEIADLKGKRLAIAAELDEGKKFSTGMIKKLCSTDDLKGEKKYKNPFDFMPTHSLVLYTNHLPKITSLDKGTWRRLIVVPFNATIEGKSDIKNYADYLVENAAPAILTWIMEGAQKVIETNYNIALPQVVKDTINGYKYDSDWLACFLDEYCIVDENALEKGTDLVRAYRAYCLRVGEESLPSIDFYRALASKGFIQHRTPKIRGVKGLRLKSEFEE